EFVDIIEVDPFDAETAEGLVEVESDLGGAERCLVRRASVGVPDLGRDLDALAEGRALRPKPLAEDGFARSAAVGVRGVEPSQAHAPRVIEQGERLRFAVSRGAEPR